MQILPLEQIEQDPRFKAATYEQQQKARGIWFQRYVGPLPAFKALAPDKQNELFGRLLAKPPVFKDEAAPEVVETRGLIERARAGDVLATELLIGKPFINTLAKGTLVGTAATWTVEKLQDLVDPGNRLSPMEYTVGPEAAKLEALVRSEVPQIGFKADLAPLVGVMATFAEAAAIGALAGGTATMARGFAKPMASGLKQLAASMPSGAVQRLVSAIGPETAQAIGGGLGFAVSNATKMAMQGNPMSLKEVAEAFGQDVAFDYGLWAISGVASRLARFAKATYFSGSYQERHLHDVMSGAVSLNPEPVLQQFEALDPKMAGRLRSSGVFDIKAKLNLGDPVDRLRVFAAPKGMNIVEVPDSLRPTVEGNELAGRRYKVQDMLSGAELTGDMTYADLLDFVAKSQGASDIRIVAPSQVSLGMRTKIRMDLKQASHDASPTALFGRRRTAGDPGLFGLTWAYVAKAEGLGRRTADDLELVRLARKIRSGAKDFSLDELQLQANRSADLEQVIATGRLPAAAEPMKVRRVPSAELFAATEADVAAGAPAGAYEWGVGRQVAGPDGTISTYFPQKGVAGSKEPSPGFKALKARLGAYMDEGIILVPDRFASVDQIHTYDRMMQDLLGDRILASHADLWYDGDWTVAPTLKDASAIIPLGEYLEPYAMSHSSALKGRNVAESVSTMDPMASRYMGRVMTQMDLESLNDLANLAYGPQNKFTGEIDRLARLETLRRPNGKEFYRVSLRDGPEATATWRTQTGPDGAPLEFDSTRDLRRHLLRQALVGGRVSNEALKTMISMRTGYQLLTPGQVLPQKTGDWVDTYKLVLQQSPTVKSARMGTAVVGLDPHAVVSASTLEGLFDQVPEVYDAVAEGFSQASTIRAVYETANPYLVLEGRVFSGSASDLHVYLRNREGKALLQEMALPNVDSELHDIVRQAETRAASARVAGMGRPQLLFDKRSERFYLTPLEGGRTLSFGGRRSFSSAEAVQQHLTANMAAYTNIFMNFARYGMYTDVLPSGAIAVFSADGTQRVFSSRAQLNAFFKRDIFEAVGLTAADSDAELAIVAEILGAHAEWNEMQAAIAAASPGASDPKVLQAVGEEFHLRRTGRLQPVDREYAVVKHAGRTMKLDLEKTHPFGWELSVGRGSVDMDRLTALLDEYDVRPRVEDGAIVMSVGSRDKAEAVAEALDGLPGISGGLESGRHRILGRVTGRFVDPSGAPVPDLEDAAIRFGNFYAGGRGYRYRSERSYGAVGRMRKFFLDLQLAVQVPLAPVSESLETLRRMDAYGATRMTTLMQQTKLLTRGFNLEAVPEKGAMKAITGSLTADESQMLGMLFRMPESSWAKVAADLDMRLTDRHRTILADAKRAFESFLTRMGISINGETFLSSVADFNHQVSVLAARAAGEDVSVKALSDLYENLKNAENIPMIMKVYSDAMRPDELAQFLRFSDLDSFLQATVDAVLRRKYFSTLREPVAKLVFDMSKAKEGHFSNFVKGTDAFFMDTFDQIVGKNTVMEQTLDGLMDAYSDAFYRISSEIPILRHSGLAKDMQFHNFMAKTSQVMSRVTQGGKPFNVLRNGTQIQLQAAAIGTGRVLRAHDYVLRHPEYVQHLMAREAISQGFFERSVDRNAVSRILGAWTRPLENSEVINRATTIRAAESLLDEYLPRLKAGLETSESFLRGIKGDCLYDAEQQFLMHLVRNGQTDAAADFLGTAWQDMTQFVYSPAELGMAFRGLMGKTWGKFMVQNVSTVAYVWKQMRTKMNPAVALAASARIVAVMYATQKAFEAVGIQYDGFKPINMLSASGGPSWQLLMNTAGLSSDPEKANRYLKSIGRTIWGTMIPLAPQFEMIDRARKMYQGGRYWDAMLALMGAPLRLEDQLLYLESFRE